MLDHDVRVRRIATSGPLWGGTSRAFCSRVEVEMDLADADPPPSLLLEWSDDGGRTWTGSRTLALAPGQSGRSRPGWAAFASGCSA